MRCRVADATCAGRGASSASVSAGSLRQQIVTNLSAACASSALTADASKSVAFQAAEVCVRLSHDRMSGDGEGDKESSLQAFMKFENVGFGVSSCGHIESRQAVLVQRKVDDVEGTP